jgi:hypothetical protein
MKKEIRYLLIAFLIYGCTPQREPCPEPFYFTTLIKNDSQDITNQYLFVYCVGKYENKNYKNIITSLYRPSSDTTLFYLPPDLNSDSVFYCFENIDGQTDTVGISYKRKLKAIQGDCRVLKFDIESQKIIYLSNRFNKDSSKINVKNRRGYYDMPILRLYKSK